jgi:hypothetical protein
MTGYSFWFYPWKLVWPENLSPLYELPARIGLLDPRFAWPTLGLVAVTILLVLGRRRVPGALAAWLQSMIVLAPVSGIAHAGHQLAHDRYSYLSGLGFAVLAGAGMMWVVEQRARGRVNRWVFGTTVAAVAMALVGLGAGSWVHSRIWRDSETLWRAAVTSDPTCALCHQKLGEVLHAAGLVADLYAHRGRHVEPAVAVYSHATGVALVACVGHVQPVVALLELQAAVRRDPITVDPVRTIIRDI